jgi:predicted GIY-YIG superfamily endonuclease
MYFVYILRSKCNGSTYIGKTRDVEGRLKEHNAGYVTTTKSGRPYETVSYFSFKDRTRADDFEMYLKSGSGRAFLKKRVL